MPRSGSQVILCDVPIRYDTYEGCSHNCAYCFVKRKNTLDVSNGESVESLRKFIAGQRLGETDWCDWDIPLHWGGMSDPFQPVELERGKSLEALKVFAETQYPFIVSTKSDLISKEPYLSLIKKCNCVVQFSAVCDRYDAMEKGASTFRERIEAARKIAPYKRVNFRVQPYTPAVFKDVLKSIDLFHEVGGAGVIFEGMKYIVKKPGTIKLKGDFVFPVDDLRKHFQVFKDKLHKLGMKFYAGENRLRAMGDSLCCCGIDGMGWKPNTGNLNHKIYDVDNYVFSPSQKAKGNTRCFLAINQDTLSRKYYAGLSFEEVMEHMYNKGAGEALIPTK